MTTSEKDKWVSLLVCKLYGVKLLKGETGVEARERITRDALESLLAELDRK